MIVARLIGGLGNQMFQYAAGRALADRLGVELVLDTRDFASYTLHAYGLERFAVRARQATPAELAHWPNWLRRPCRFAQRLGMATRWHAELRFGYDAAWPALGDNLLLDGYFQSEKYFASIADALRADFVPRAALSAVNAAVADTARHCESVMIHVRRGDYVSNAKTLQIHGVCSPTYYEASIAAMRARLANPRFFVFSNDMAWARDNLPLGADAVFIEGNAKDPEMDIHLMAQCRHHIVANSSFSWWGAWLGAHPQKTVIAPHPWFDSVHSAADLVPASWLAIRK